MGKKVLLVLLALTAALCCSLQAPVAVSAQAAASDGDDVLG